MSQQLDALQRCDALCVGEALVMVAPDDAGRLDLQSHFSLHVGGAESNVASHLASLGHRSFWASRVGDDPFGEIIRTHLSDVGVDISMTEVTANAPTGVYFKDPQRSRTTVHYYRRGSAASTMDATFLSYWPELNPAVVHVSGITPALSIGCRDLMHELVIGRAFGTTCISFDVNYRPALWDLATASTELLTLARASDVCFVGRDEAETLWGTRTPAEIRELLPEPRALVVKDGAVEAVEFAADDGVHQVMAPAVDVVEVVGAGDAFAAGWLSGWLRGLDPTRRLRLGHLIAAYVLQSVSDEAQLPDPAILEDFINREPSTWRLARNRTEHPGHSSNS